MKEREDNEDVVPAHESPSLEGDGQTTSIESGERDAELWGAEEVAFAGQGMKSDQVSQRMRQRGGWRGQEVFQVRKS